MNTLITKVEDALSLELGMLYDAEAILTERLAQLTSGVSSQTLKSICRKYAESGSYKRVKIKRMFSYLAAESRNKQDEVIRAFLKDIEYCLHCTSESNIRDFLIAGIVIKLNHYKSDSYRTAQGMAMKLDWEVVSDLLGELLDWESKTKNELLDVASQLYNGESNLQSK